jgi:hypothetical protein
MNVSKLILILTLIIVVICHLYLMNVVLAGREGTFFIIYSVGLILSALMYGVVLYYTQYIPTPFDKISGGDTCRPA